MLDNNKKSISNRKLSDGYYILDTGNRRDESVALIEKKRRDNKKGYGIVFNYEIKDNKISWDYGYYYDNYDKETVKQDFKKVLKGYTLNDIYNEKQKNKNKEMER